MLVSVTAETSACNREPGEHTKEPVFTQLSGAAAALTSSNCFIQATAKSQGPSLCSNSFLVTVTRVSSAPDATMWPVLAGMTQQCFLKEEEGVGASVMVPEVLTSFRLSPEHTEPWHS